MIITEHAHSQRQWESLRKRRKSRMAIRTNQTDIAITPEIRAQKDTRYSLE